MIIVHLIGGLGNQMFQYAAGLRAALHHNVPLKMDIHDFYKYEDRSYNLNHFNISGTLADEIEIAQYKNDKKSFFCRWIERTKPYYRRKYVIEKTMAFDPNILHISSDTYLEGYWQSHHYFVEIESRIREEFKVSNPLTDINKNFAKKITSTDSVCVHVRRGDYISNTEANNFHGICSLDYYQKSFEIINSRVKEPTFFIFSDDHQWVMEKIKPGENTVYVNHNGPAKNYEDMRLMSLCKHYIIANSSFSWWGAWLGSAPDKFVIAPKRWFSNDAIDLYGRIPEKWLIV